jgi:hypothetical protein
MLTPGQKLYKRIPFSCHTCPLPLLWHEFDNCNYFLQYKVSCCPQVEDLGKILHDLGRSWQGQGLGKPLILARSCQDITNTLPRLFNLAKIVWNSCQDLSVWSFMLSAHVLSLETPFASWQIGKWPRQRFRLIYILYWHTTVDIIAF